MDRYAFTDSTFVLWEPKETDCNHHHNTGHTHEVRVEGDMGRRIPHPPQAPDAFPQALLLQHRQTCTITDTGQGSSSLMEEGAVMLYLSFIYTMAASHHNFPLSLVFQKALQGWAHKMQKSKLEQTQEKYLVLPPTPTPDP